MVFGLRGVAAEDGSVTAESTSVKELAEVIWRKIKGPDVPLSLTSDTPWRAGVT